MKKLNNEYFVCKIEAWNDLFMFSQDFLSHFIYRGQSNSCWGLTTSLERLVSKLHANFIDPIMPELYEQENLKDFKWKFPLYAEGIKIPNQEEGLEWLSLMQHYGAPTRLLDFTYSPFVALFMAIDNFYSGCCSLWCLNKYMINNYILNRYRQTHGYNNVVFERELGKFKYEYANKLITKGEFVSNRPKGLILITPHIVNERINAQQGLFVMPTNMECSFEENFQAISNYKKPQEIPIEFLMQYSKTSQGLSSQSDIAIIKFNIPLKLKYQITTMLRQINITHETMYPGIEGLAKSMTILRHKDTMYTS